MTMTIVAGGVELSSLLPVLGQFVGPVIGLALLIVGMRLRARDRRRPPVKDGVVPRPVPEDQGMAPLPYPAVEPYPGTPLPGLASQGWVGPSSRKRLRGTTLALVGATVFGITTMGELGFHALTDKPLPSVAIGDCVTEQSLIEPGRPKPVDCALPNTMELAAYAEGQRCPDGPINKTLYIVIDISKTVTWCLVPNFTEGQCFRADSLETIYEVTDCTGIHADIKVARRIDNGVSDLCPDETTGMHYPQPLRLYCLQVLKVPTVPV